MTGEVRVGEQFAGYRIESVLGRGGMSVVYLAHDLALERRVALKVMAPELAQDERFRERFIQESRAAAALDHPNIVPIYEAREVEGLLYIAMRYVRGTDLRSLLAREGPLEPGRAVGIVGQAAAALDAAHAAGLVHRDVKPANILLAAAPDGGAEHVYLADFGLTKVGAGRSLTATGQFVGTVEYVAPEQIEGKDVDGRADVYSLGCVLFECLTGTPPFHGDVDVATLWAHVHDRPPAVTDLRPELPQALDQVVGKALGKSPEVRYRTAGELAAAARQVVGSGSDERLTGSLPEAPAPRRRTLLAGGVAAAAAVVGLLVFLLSPRGVPPHTAPSATSSVSVSQPTAPAPTGTTSSLVEGTGLFRLDPQSGKPAARLGSDVLDPGLIGALVVGEGGIWAYDGTDGRVYEVKPQTRAVAAIVPAYSNGGFFDGQGALWVQTDFPSRVERIDPLNGHQAGTVLFPLHPTGPLSSPAGGLVWSLGSRFGAKEGTFSGGGASLVGIDADTNKIVVAIGLPSASGLCTLGGDLWLAEPVTSNLGPPRLVRLDARTGRVLGTVPDLPIQPVAMACGAGRIWLLDQGLTLIGYQPSGTSAVTTGIVAIPGQAESGFDFSTGLVVAGDEVLVVQRISRTVWVVDPQLKSVVATAQYRGQPEALGSDGSTAWLAVR